MPLNCAWIVWRRECKADEMITVEPLNESHLGDLAILFASDAATDRCWCMWFLRPVKEFHAVGHDGNRSSFMALVLSSPTPMGVVAYNDGDAIGWAATGPRNRYTRAIATPTMKQRTGDDDTTWLVPCFFVHAEYRSGGVAQALLEAATSMAASAGAAAIEGFPLAGPRRRAGGSDLMAGVEPLFVSGGFVVDHRPTDNRVVMRRVL